MADTIDWAYFEKVLAYKVSTDEQYAGALLGVLNTDHIENEAVREHVANVLTFYETHDKLPDNADIQLMLPTLEQKQRYISLFRDIRTLTTNMNRETVFKITEDYIKQRSLLHAIRQMLPFVSHGESRFIDPEKTLQLFEKAVNVNLHEHMGSDYFNEIEQHIEELKRQEQYISTGFPWLDFMLGGGWLLNGKSLYIISGATNAGKSIMLGNLALQTAKQGKTVVIVTLEMSEEVYKKRLSAQLSNIEMSKLSVKTDDLRFVLEHYKDEHPQARIIIKEFPSCDITPNHIKSFLKQLKHKKGVEPDAVFIDYIGLLKPNKEQKSLYESGKQVAVQIRGLSYFFECPFIAALQLNRGGYNEKGEPTVDTSSESIAIPQTADAQFVVWRRDSDTKAGLPILYLSCQQKNRFGPNRGTRGFSINWDTLAVQEMEEGESAMESKTKKKEDSETPTPAPPANKNDPFVKLSG